MSGYIDDTYLRQQLFNDALNSLHACKSLFTSLGLLIHPEKSLDHSKSNSDCVRAGH